MTAATPATLAGREDQAAALLSRVTRAHAPAVFAAGFGAEDMVVLDLIARHRLPIGVVTLIDEATHATVAEGLIQ